VNTKTTPAPKKPEPLSDEELQRVVESIRAIGDVGMRMDRCGLARRAQLVLLADITQLPMTTISRVLDGLIALPSKMLTRK
jgi:hypothetical protein